MAPGVAWRQSKPARERDCGRQKIGNEMSVEIKVPSLGESVTEATVGQWFKAVGDKIEADEPLVELETDKVTLEVNAPSSGVLAEIAAGEGDEVEVGALLGKIDESGAAVAKPAAAETPTAEAAEAPKAVAPAAAAGDSIVSPAARKLAADNGLDIEAIKGTGKDGRILKEDVLRAIDEAKAAPAKAPAEPTPSVGPRPGAEVLRPRFRVSSACA